MGRFFYTRQLGLLIKSTLFINVVFRYRLFRIKRNTIITSNLFGVILNTGIKIGSLVTTNQYHSSKNH